jgi:hypothetical protein
VAGGAALNELLHAPRVSRDIDLFHDTESALDASWNADRELLVSNGFTGLDCHRHEHGKSDRQALWGLVCLGSGL